MRLILKVPCIDLQYIGLSMKKQNKKEMVEFCYSLLSDENEDLKRKLADRI